MGKIITLQSGRSLDLSGRARIMGIINCTPDSFFQESRHISIDSAIACARKMISDGADILDLGGESSRPGSDYVSAEEELARLVPVFRGIRSESKIPISIDTRKASVAAALLEEGADIINDISGLRDDPDLLPLVISQSVPVVLMHMKGNPKTMQVKPEYGDTLGEIGRELAACAQPLLDGGHPPEKIILDPGIGFGKRQIDNLLILKNLNQLCRLGFPVLIGVSRKAFIGSVLRGKGGAPKPAEDRLTGTIAAQAAALMGGASILRVHDVKEAVDLSRMMWAISSAGEVPIPMEANN
jgi:dihydropteroate synthase